MALTYRRPGVYLEESLLSNPGDVGAALAVALFAGAAAKGQKDEPVRCESWSDFVNLYGGFGDITNNAAATATPYLPYAVYSFFQNGGRVAYVARSVGSTAGAAATYTITDGGGTPVNVLKVDAIGVGTWGNNIKIIVANEAVAGMFSIRVLYNGTEVERFNNLSMSGTTPGTKAVDNAINDPYSGSQYVRVTVLTRANNPDGDGNPADYTLAGGTNPSFPDAAALQATAKAAAAKIEGPVIINIAGHTTDTADPTKFISATLTAADFPDRGDVFIINDSAPPRAANADSGTYATALTSTLGTNVGDSYVASYSPWIIIPNPIVAGGTISVPPGGAVAGVMARIDTTTGVFRAPAGVIATVNNAVGVETKYTDTQLGDLNNKGINVIRSVVGAGICVMGARTRKTYGADRYVSARRTLIYVKEALRGSTQFAIFENNDQRLWGRLTMTAERILRPLWEAGGLRGTNPAEAYYIRCDESINTPAAIQSGEVRMEVGVALEYPAEFIIIKVTQYDQGSFSEEVRPLS